MGIEEIKARIAAVREQTAAKRAAQEEIDLAAFADLLEEHGDGRVVQLVVERYVPGLPERVVIQTPGGTAYYKRYTDQVRRSKGDRVKIGEAQELLGKSVLVYPPPGEVRTALEQAFPGLYASCGVEAEKLAELHAEEEKKG